MPLADFVLGASTGTTKNRTDRRARAGLATRVPASPWRLWHSALLFLAAAAQTARGAIPAGVHIDEALVLAFLGGGDICGDHNHREACLRRVPCDDADPLWMADGQTSGQGGGTRALFRAILPPSDVNEHPNFSSLGSSAHKMISAKVFWMLPRAVALYGVFVAKQAHKMHCPYKYCRVPDELYGESDREKGVAFPSSNKKVRLSLCMPQRRRASQLRVGRRACGQLGSAADDEAQVRDGRRFSVRGLRDPC